MIYYERLTQRQDNSNLRAKRYDMETCTVADYSIRVNLTNEFYSEFQEEKRSGRAKDILSYLSKNIESTISGLDQVLRKKGGEYKNDAPEKYEIKVASIRLAYQNRQIIQELRKRGAKLGADAKFEDIDKIEQTINRYVTEQNDRMTTPVAAYVTFTT